MKRNATSLRDLFGEIFERSVTDPIEHIVVMTYEFDDQQMLNMSALQSLGKSFEPRRKHLSRIAKLAPIVLYDARKTKEATRLPHFLDLLPVQMLPYTCHHSKAYLIVTRKAVHLILGSMNLTATGLFENREVFEAFCLTDSEHMEADLVRDFVKVLSHETYASFASQRLGAVIQELERRLSTWGASANLASVRLLHQGYGTETGFSALKRAWDDYFGADDGPERAIVVSPFFDQSLATSSAAAKLFQHFPTLSSLEVITDDAVAALLCKRHFAPIGHAKLHLIPQELSEFERQSIALANQTVDSSARVLKRKLHAKILVISRGHDVMVYIGSANFTRKAWDGGNKELGFVRVMQDRSDGLLDLLTQNLGAATSDHFPLLPDIVVAQPPPGEDDYVESKGYPDFVLGIELRESEIKGAMFFEFRISTPGDVVIQDYDITWGKEALCIAAGRSQDFPQAQLSRCLVGGRNLCFRLRANPERCFYLPFRHYDSLFENRELYVYRGAADWMLSYLGIEPSSDREEGERLPGDDEDDGNESDDNDSTFLSESGPQRYGNPVIRMQQYLSLFSRIETEFRARAQACSKASRANADRRWSHEVIHPLTTLADVIAKEDLGQGLTPDGIFKLGELALFCRRLTDRFPVPCAGLLKAMKSRLPKRHDDPAVRQYLKFCLSELQR